MAVMCDQERRKLLVSHANRTYVITGSASGIGAETRRILEAGGARVVGIDLRSAEIEADLSDVRQVESLGRRLAALDAEIVDGVATCAGVSGGMGEPKMIVELNYFGTVGVIEQLYPFLSRSQNGRVVALSSIAMLRQAHSGLFKACAEGGRAAACALAADGAMRGRTAYETTKRAISAWIRQQALQEKWIEHRILLNAVAPGVIDTPLTQYILQDQQARTLALQRAPQALGVGKPEHVAALIAFLLSAANGFVTGQTIFADGGHEAQVGAGMPGLSAESQAAHDSFFTSVAVQPD